MGRRGCVERRCWRRDRSRSALIVASCLISGPSVTPSCRDPLLTIAPVTTRQNHSRCLSFSHRVSRSRGALSRIFYTQIYAKQIIFISMQDLQ